VKPSPLRSPLKFLGEVRAEGARVTWPTRQETWRLTLFVFAMVAISTIFFFFVDWAIGQAVHALFTAPGLR
jgi:preprotein translocase subunit SecE